jgi:transposase-like protein
MSRQRRRFTAEVKAQIVRRHLAGKEPVSQLAEEFGVQPSQIHGWVNLVLSQAEKAFERSATNGRSELATVKAKDQRIEQLQAKIVHKNEVIAELMEANVLAKKELGEL